MIRREFGVSYHIGYLPKRLKSLGWSVQKPRRQALERDQAVIDEWVAEDWPRIKKKSGGSPRR